MVASTLGSRLARHKKLSWSVAILVLLTLWWWRGDIQQAKTTAPAPREMAASSKDFVIQAQEFNAEPYQASLVVQGKLAAIHSVNLRAQVSGTVQRRPELGQAVSQDEPLIKLSDEGRAAQLNQAKADLALRQAEADAGQRLRAKQHISQTQLLSLKSAAASAKASVASAQLALQHNQVSAPFSGKVDSLAIEVGDFVQAGDELLKLVNVERLKLMASVSQQDVSKLREGLPVRALLLDGRELNGQLDFIAYTGDDQTRSFAIEAKIDNPLGWRVAGASASLSISLPEQEAVRLSPALLALNKHSQLGVYVLDQQNRMHWQAVNLLSITPQTAWVSGLDQSVRIVTRGADFVALDTPLNVQIKPPNEKSALDTPSTPSKTTPAAPAQELTR